MTAVFHNLILLSSHIIQVNVITIQTKEAAECAAQLRNKKGFFSKFQGFWAKKNKVAKKSSQSLAYIRYTLQTYRQLSFSIAQTLQSEIL